MNNELKLYPSDADTWTKCTAKPEATRNSPYESSPEAETGKQLHKLASEYLLNNDESLFKGVAPLYVNWVKSYCEFCKSLEGEIYTEVKIKTICGNGIIDFLSIDQENKSVTVVDLKTGYAPVIVEGNKQLIIYASRFIKDFDSFTLVIHQQGKMYSHTYSKEELISLMQPVKNAVKLIKEGSVEFKAGEHCKYCPIRIKCKYRLEYIKNTLADCSSDTLSTYEMVELRKKMDAFSRDFKKQIETNVAENGAEAEKVKYKESTFYSWNGDYESIKENIKKLTDFELETKTVIVTTPKEVFDELGLFDAISEGIVYATSRKTITI